MPTIDRGLLYDRSVFESSTVAHPGWRHDRVQNLTPSTDDCNESLPPLLWSVWQRQDVMWKRKNGVVREAVVTIPVGTRAIQDTDES